MRLVGDVYGLYGRIHPDRLAVELKGGDMQERGELRGSNLEPSDVGAVAQLVWNCDPILVRVAR
jgi:hypothetical protein